MSVLLMFKEYTMLKALFLSVVCGSRPASMAEFISQARSFGRAVVT